MKARNTITGETVSDFGISKEFGTVSYIDSKGVLRFEAAKDGEWEIVRGDDLDWRSFRAETARDFAVAILSNPRWSDHFNGTDKCFQFDHAYYKKNVVGNALSYADELIERLKKTDENGYIKESENESAMRSALENLF